MVWIGKPGILCFFSDGGHGTIQTLTEAQDKVRVDTSAAKAFETSKVNIVEKIKEGVMMFDPNLPTCVATDFSGTGIGYFLLQKTCSCEGRRPDCCQEGWRICLAGSRFLHDAETRYAPIEGELLAVAYAVHQCRYFILGCPDFWASMLTGI